MVKRILAGALGIILLLTLAYYSGSLMSERAMQEEQAKLQERIEYLESAAKKAASAPRLVQAETPEAEKTARFYLKEQDGTVSIYQGDGTTLYETTDIPISLLPDALQGEIRAGKAIQDEAELYDFLENYSS